MRAMFLEFIDDRTTHHLDQQYMLGPSLLVAPVFVSADEETEYYLPAGRWTSFYNPQRVVQGPTWIKEKVALDDIPLWVRQGSVVLLGRRKQESPTMNTIRPWKSGSMSLMKVTRLTFRFRLEKERRLRGLSEW